MSTFRTHLAAHPEDGPRRSAREVVRVDNNSRTVIGTLGKTLQALKAWSPVALTESIRNTDMLLEVKGPH